MEKESPRKSSAHEPLQSDMSGQVGGGAMQLAANNSPQVSQLRALQQGVSQSPQVQKTAQLQSSVNRKGPVQMMKKDVVEYAKDNAFSFGFHDVSSWEKKDVVNFINDDNESFNLRSEVLWRWNKGLATSSKDFIPTPEKYQSVKRKKFSEKEELDSEESETEDFNQLNYFEVLREQMGGEMIEIIKAGGESNGKVPVFYGFPAASKMVRLWWNARKRGHEDQRKTKKIEGEITSPNSGTKEGDEKGLSTTGAQFAVKVGDRYGLYEKRMMEDLFFMNLAPYQDEDGNVHKGKYIRSTGEANWEKLGIMLEKKQQSKKDEKVLTKLLDIVEGKSSDVDEEYMEAAGAMSTDSKRSIMGYTQSLDDIRDLEGTKLTEIFHRKDKSKDEPKYALAVRSGRQLTVKTREKKYIAKRKEKEEKSKNAVKKALTPLFPMEGLKTFQEEDDELNFKDIKEEGEEYYDPLLDDEEQGYEGEEEAYDREYNDEVFSEEDELLTLEKEYTKDKKVKK